MAQFRAAQTALAALREKGIDLSPDDIRRALTGRNGAFRKTKPPGQSRDVGILHYLWRMTRFTTGIDPRMPINCFYELSNDLERRGVDHECYGVISPDASDTIDHLDALIDNYIIPRFELAVRLNPWHNVI